MKHFIYHFIKKEEQKVIDVEILWHIISGWKVAVSFLYGLKCLFTVDLFCVYLPSRVDNVIRFTEVDFKFGPLDYVRYIEEFVISRFVYRRFIPHLLLQLWPGQRISFVISRTSVNRGSLNLGSTVTRSITVDTFKTVRWEFDHIFSVQEKTSQQLTMCEIYMKFIFALRL